MSDGPSGHLDLEALAELEEGLVEPQAAAAARAHAETCEECRSRMSRLRTTRALLSALPPEPMPARVTARLDAALAHERDAPTGTIVPLTGRRRSWNSPAVAGGAAAAAVVVLVAAIVAGTLVHHGDKHRTDTPAAAGTGSTFGGDKAAATKQWSTGTDYTPATIATLVPRLVIGTPPAGAVTGGQAGSVGAGGAVSSPAPPSAGTPATTGSTTPSYTQDELRSSPAALAACGRILAGGVPTTPVAVDFGRFEGKPAVIFALPAIGHPSSLDIWVVRSSCSSANLDLYFQRIPRP